MTSLTIVLVWLTCAPIESNQETYGFKKDCHRKTCLDTEYDTREAVCCENRLHPGPGLLCCGKFPFNPAEATCCKVEQGNKVTAPYDEDTQLCCGPQDKEIMLRKNSSYHVCCGQDQYDKERECCCWVNDSFDIQPSGSSCCVETSGQAVPALCGDKSYNTLNELCCGSSVVTKTTPETQCCGKGTFEKDKQLCCGLDEIILEKISHHHECCGHDQYNTLTECCCWLDDSLQKQPINSECCKEELGLLPEKPGTQLDCTQAHAALNGSSCFNLTDYICCKRQQIELPLSTADPGNAAPSVPGPDTHVSCAEWKPSYQCCSGTPSSLAQHQSCSQTLFTDRENAENFSDTCGPIHPAKGTTCCSRFHGSPGQHCCGTEVYQPHNEICCSGQRHRRQDNWHCCGVHSYNIMNRRIKCCGGTVYILASDRSAEKAQCCGSILLKPSDVCCSSEHKEVLYSAKTGFRCCGHLYYNTSLWSCSAEKTNKQKQGQHERRLIKGCTFVSLVNLNEYNLCEEINVGIVDSVSLHSIVFSSVVIISGRNSAARPLPSTHIMRTPDHCSFPKLIPGQTYFFNHTDIFTDFYHDSLLKSLHFIFSKCHHP
ncbi:uncharacterized protein si:ch211-195m9.3 isoform X2 [Cheilinus undulatus]|uniref:uncharacterized protein si:ch211-195m9.3 isoform X2 n=1 Tax=Cheilinus undulatus TaxID=241271 RepID=UPI001BD605F1|nr:uncharacterized protein si:ch211-195m9.3 isoform X2 [Cheilinus undulatus]